MCVQLPGGGLKRRACLLRISKGVPFHYLWLRCLSAVLKHQLRSFTSDGSYFNLIFRVKPNDASVEDVSALPGLEERPSSCAIVKDYVRVGSLKSAWPSRSNTLLLSNALLLAGDVDDSVARKRPRWCRRWAERLAAKCAPKLFRPCSQCSL